MVETKLADAYVALVPNISGLQESIEKELARIKLKPAGTKMGSVLAESLNRSFSPTVDAGIAQGIAGLIDDAGTGCVRVAEQIMQVTSSVETFELTLGSLKAPLKGLSQIFTKDIPGAFSTFGSKLEELAASRGLGIDGRLKAIGSASSGMAQGLLGAVGAVGGMAFGLLGLGLAAATGGVDLEEMAGKVTGTMAAVTIGLPKVVEQMATLLPALVAQVVEALPAFTQVIIEAFSSIVALLPQVLPQLIEGVAQMVASLAVALIGMVPQLVDAGLQLFTGLIQALGLILPAIVEALPAMVQGIGEAILTNLPTILDAGLQLFLGIVEALLTIIPILIEMLPTFIVEFAAMLVSLVPQLLEGAILLFTALVEALPTIASALVSAIPGVIEAVIRVLPTLIPQLMLAGVRLFVALVEALPKIIPSLIGAIPTVISAFVGAFPAMIPQIVNAGKQLFSGIADALPHVLHTLLQVGGDIVAGIARGIAGAGWKVIEAIGGAITGAINWAKGLLGIRSPSKVFAEFGRYIDEGLGLGIADNAEAAIAPMKDLISDIVDAAQADVPPVEVPLEAMPAEGAFGGLASQSALTGIQVAASQSSVVNNFSVSATVREEGDIRKIANELFRLQVQAERAYA